MSPEPALRAGPAAPLLALPCSTGGTGAGCAPFRSRQAFYANPFGFFLEILNVLAILPEAHPLTVISPFAILLDSVRIADEDFSDLVFQQKIYCLSGPIMAKALDSSFVSLGLAISTSGDLAKLS